METQFTWRRLNGDALESNLKESVENVLKKEPVGSLNRSKGFSLEFI